MIELRNSDGQDLSHDRVEFRRRFEVEYGLQFGNAVFESLGLNQSTFEVYHLVPKPPIVAAKAEDVG